ncbi:NADH-quinone oxidoreductase subunit NuoE [Senegalia massiliensis]|uniref:NADH-quinone oxidoreductase subunit NuoE n=1 Tax=Senegalia massiliensis TaxID=1720316 RepID=UPI00103270CE|nr:NADH-quinone oxidoreductase subunit NuoE [Senegalia massiliensis]
MNFVFDKDKNNDKIIKLENFIEKNKDKLGVLMPVMQEAQNIFGYLPKEILELISNKLNIPISEIYGVATFYSQFTFIPEGENKINVCIGTACYVKGAQEILDEIEEILQIKYGETTKDMKFSIVAARCLGDCSKAPVITINDDVYPMVKKEEISSILDKYR